MTSAAAMQTNTQRVPKQGKFFIIDTDIRGEGPGHGVVIANEDKLLSPPLNYSVGERWVPGDARKSSSRL